MFEDTAPIFQHHIACSMPCWRSGSAMGWSQEEPFLTLGQCGSRNGCRLGPVYLQSQGREAGRAHNRGSHFCNQEEEGELKRTQHRLKPLLCVFPQARETPTCPWQGDDVFRDKYSPCPRAFQHPQLLSSAHT